MAGWMLPAVSVAREVTVCSPAGGLPQSTLQNFHEYAELPPPSVMVAGIHDKQVTPERVRELYDDLGASQKVMIDLGCSSHNAMWERNHLLMFKASLDWLSSGTVNGEKDGVVKLGY